MRKIIVYIATSADGFIARPDGDVSWLDRPKSAGDYGMGAFYKTIDTTLMGRKTYDIGRKLGQESYPGKKNYVFSRTHDVGESMGVEFVARSAGAFARRLRGVEGKDIWLVGGGELVGSFLDAGEIDELVIHVVPTLIGEGIPLLHPRHRSVPLNLLSSRAFPDGVVRLHYAVSKGAAPKRSPRRAAGRKRR
jgi:dihydrofolate reductase